VVRLGKPVRVITEPGLNVKVPEGFTSAWDGLRGAICKGRSVETEGPLLGFLTHDAIKSFYLHGAAHPELISPDDWESDYGFMQRPHSVRMNLDLFYDYRNNVVLYPLWQMFLRDRQPKTLIFWGQNDIFFTPAGGEAFLRDVPKAEMHRLAGGHFAVEDNLEYIASNMKLLRGIGHQNSLTFGETAVYLRRKTPPVRAQLSQRGSAQLLVCFVSPR
jgi:pimeloyl-ACP methyl ester carboxylesterase